MTSTSMKEKIQQLKRASFVHKFYKKRLWKMLDDRGCFLKFPPYEQDIHEMITATRDPVRYTSIALALRTIEREKIPGNLAELGVYRGATSRIIHRILPDRPLYLFDTFEGFAPADLKEADARFRDTSLDLVKKTIGDLTHIVFRQGYFPETAQGLEAETFSFVLLDADKFKPTLAGLEFFYPRLSSGGYVFVHDYNSPESNYDVSKAVQQFMSDKKEKILEMADSGGSVVFRKF